MLIHGICIFRFLFLLHLDLEYFIGNLCYRKFATGLNLYLYAVCVNCDT